MTPSSSIFTAYPLADYEASKADIDAAIQHVLTSGHYILGGEVDAFEKEFAAWVGVKHCIGVANGTDAIELLLRGLDIGQGDCVAVPSHTAVASAAGISRAGARPVFVDIDEKTLTVCPQALDELLRSPGGSGIKAILAVHMYGHPAAWAELERVAARHRLELLEDCAQAHGASDEGRMAGSLGRGAAFSFYPTKNLGALGDGGAITTSDEVLAERIRVLRQYGWGQRYISSVEGVNSRLDELQAAILRVKLPTLDLQLSRRRALASRYQERLTTTSIALPWVRNGAEHAYHLYVIRSGDREGLKRHLTERGIPVALHYPAAIHQQPAYQRHAAKSPALPVTERLVNEILTLPLHPHLSERAVDAVCDAILEYHER